MSAAEHVFTPISVSARTAMIAGNRVDLEPR
jgi:hypothetical protein